MRIRRIRAAAVYAACLALLVLAFLSGINAGSVPIPSARILQILTGAESGTTEADIIMKIRLPRTLTAAILGGGLAVSGFLLQTFFANPIAGPYILGISSGAKLTVALLMIGLLGQSRHMSSLSMVGAALIGKLVGFYPFESGITAGRWPPSWWQASWWDTFAPPLPTSW